MIELSAAVELVQRYAFALRTIHQVAVAEALDRVLAADVVSPRDVPPQAKSLVDGYAVRVADLVAGPRSLIYRETVAAGSLPQQEVLSGTTIQVMTGAPIPVGADAVVMREQTSDAPLEGVIHFRVQAIAPGSNIAPLGSSISAGETIFPAGRRLSAIDVGILAELGLQRVPLVARPKVTVLATGSELVAAGEVAALGASYNSNGPMLCGLLSRLGAEVVDLGIAHDDPAELSAAIAQGLTADLFLLTGGVSAGDWDLVPGELERAHVQRQFHRVRLKPGKPVWFGVLRGSRAEVPADPGADQPRCLVFGLPGNPVSTLVCFHLFVAPALRIRAGELGEWPTAGVLQAPLSESWTRSCDRPTFWPATLLADQRGTTIMPLPWRGSYDLRALAQANALIYLDVGDHELASQSLVSYISLIR